MLDYDPVRYKQTQKQNWNANAPHYHESFVGPQAGPFQENARLVRAAQVGVGDHVLDVATGTGAVALELAKAVGQSGKVVGVDLSPGMLALARQGAKAFPWLELLEVDAEALTFEQAFDAVTCQFGLMFFPDVQGALSGMRRALKPHGRLAVAVHGRPENVPFFTAITQTVMDAFPPQQPNAGPGPLRFSNPDKLRAELQAAGFERVQLESSNCEIRFPSVDHYWHTFFQGSPRSFADQLEGLSEGALQELKASVRSRAQAYLHGNELRFPWEVTVAAAQKPGAD